MIEKNGTYTHRSEFISIDPFKTITMGGEVQEITVEILSHFGNTLRYNNGIIIRLSHIDTIYFDIFKRMGYGVIDEAFIQTKDREYRVPKEHFLNALTNHQKIILGITTKGERHEEED